MTWLISSNLGYATTKLAGAFVTVHLLVTTVHLPFTEHPAGESNNGLGCSMETAAAAKNLNKLAHIVSARMSDVGLVFSRPFYEDDRITSRRVALSRMTYPLCDNHRKLCCSATKYRTLAYRTHHDSPYRGLEIAHVKMAIKGKTLILLLDLSS